MNKDVTCWQTLLFKLLLLLFKCLFTLYSRWLLWNLNLNLRNIIEKAI